MWCDAQRAEWRQLRKIRAICTTKTRGLLRLTRHTRDAFAFSVRYGARHNMWLMIPWCSLGLGALLAMCTAVMIGVMMKFGGNVERIVKDAGKVTTRLIYDAAGEFIL